MNEFHRVSLKPKTFTREFKTETATVTEASFTRTDISSVHLNPIKFYNVGDDEYAYCDDGYLYKRLEDGFTIHGLSATTAVPPLVLPVIRNGQKKAIIITDTTAIIAWEELHNIPYGKSGIYFGGRLFIASGNKVYYSAEFDFTDFSVGLSFGGFVETDAYSGEALYLFADDEKLYIVCRYAVYTLKPFGEPYEFKMEKILSGLDIADNSVYPFGDGLNFISGKELYLFRGGKIKFLSGGLRAFSDITVKSTGANGGYYIAHVLSGNDDYLFVYDNDTGKETLQRFDGYTVTGRYAKLNGENKLYLVGLRERTVTANERYSGVYDFGSCAKKAIVRVEAHIDGSCRVNVVGDGVFRATLTEDCNSVSCFLHGRRFIIAFDTESNDFKAYRLTVYYVDYGE